MNPQDMFHLDETRDIVEAVRRIRSDRTILDLAKDNLSGALDRLQLAGNARTVVTPILTTALAIAVTVGPAKPESFWS